MKIKKSFIKLSAYLPQVLLLLSILTSNIFLPAVVIAEEIEQLPQTEVVEVIPIDESEDILEEGLSTSIYEEEETQEEVLEEEVIDEDIVEEEEVLEEEVINEEIVEEEEVVVEDLEKPEKKNPIKKVWDNNGSIYTTTQPIELNIKYVSPQNEDVTVTFTKLPNKSGYLSIEEVILTDKEVVTTNAISRIAYDITTDMEDGTFEYDLTLPSYEEGIKVLYSENRNALLDTLQEVDNTIVNENGNIKIKDLDHFTIYITTYSDPSFSIERDTYARGETIYVKAGDLNTSKYYKIRLNPNGYGNNVYSPDCYDPTPSNDELTFSYLFPSNAKLGNWKAELIEYDRSNCSDKSKKKASDTFEVVETPPVANPDLPTEACGLDIALVLDVSGSINAGELAQMKAAFIDFVDALAGTPTQFSVTQFSTTASVLQPFTSDYNAVKSAINSAGGGGWTNWEDGFIKAWSTYDPRTDKPNLMIFSSDGNPNKKGTSGTNASESEAVAAAVIIADTIKTAGIRILALGIGSDLDTDNMIAISGSNVDTGDILTSDVITSDFADLANDLGELANKTCGGTITVKKYIDTTAIPGGSGWEYTVSGITTKNLITGTDGTDNTGKIPAGTYSVVETNMLTGYSYGFAICKDQSGVIIGSSITDGWGNITIDDEDIISCEFINTTNPSTGTIIVHKDVVGPHGEDIYDTQTYSVKLDGGTPQSIGDEGEVTFNDVIAGDHIIYEASLPGGSELVSITPDSDPVTEGAQVTLVAEDTLHVYVTNKKYSPSIYGHKYNDVNANGVYDSGIDQPLSGWTIFIDTNGNGDLDSGETSNITNAQGEYSFLDLSSGLNIVCEELKGGWTQSYPTDNNGCHKVTLGVLGAGNAVAEDIDFLNYETPGLTVIKQVINDHGGTATIDDFEIKIGGSLITFGAGVESGDTITYTSTPSVLANISYSLSEKDVTGYTEGTWECLDDATGGTVSNPVVLSPGQNVTCTITNNDQQAYIIVDKTVVNDDGGSANPNDFNLTIDDNPVLDEALYAVNPGSHIAGETNLPGYTEGTWGGNCDSNGNVTVALGETKTCTITNNDVAPILTLVKILPNDDGGNEDQSAFNAYIDSIPAVWGANITSAGTHTVSESTLAGYTASVWGGDCSDIGIVSLNPGDEKTCTITNNDEAPSITLIKNVINDDNGTATENDFGLTIDGNPATSGVAYNVVANSPIALDEFGLAGYSFVSIIGAGCPTELGGTVTLNEGEDITCTITNDDIPPVTINAYKIVCTDESELPNWGTGGPNIDENTAQNWVDSHDSCEFKEDWSFQWGDEASSSINPGDNTGESSDARWHTFGPTDGNGLTTIEIQSEEIQGFNYIWMREILQEGYIPFTYNTEGQNNSNDVTAEIYCHTDVLNYDNLDRIDNIEYGETYYCVAWNVLNKGDLEVTKTVDWTGITPDSSQTFEICVSGPSYPTGNCKVFDYDGEVLTWTDLLAGDYTITETDPGTLWAVTDSASTVYVGYDTQSSHEILNTYVPYCGDGVINQDTEQCDGDDGVTDGENFCTPTCKLVPIYDGNHACAPGTTPIKVGDTYTLGSQDPDGVDIALINGQEYLFKVSGTYQFGNNSNRLADAAYGTEDAWSSTRDDLGIWGIAHRGVLSVLADLGIGIGIVEWDNNKIVNDLHVYQKVFTPTNDITATFLISDWYDGWYANSCDNQSCMGDNSGSLDLEVYECQEYGSIQGRKYYDVNANGDFDQVEKQEPGNPNRLDDWTIELYNDSWDLVNSMLTGDNETLAGNVGKGQYRFVDVIPGTYHVCEVLKDEWYQTEPTSGQEHEGTYCHTVTVTPGDEITGIQFGNYEGSDVTICKLDAESNGLSAWKVILRGINPLESVTVGTDGGIYSSSVLPIGNYALLSSGTYEYRGSSGLLTDPAYSERLASDGYTGTYFPWINTMDLGTPGALGIMINGLPTNWGNYLSENHRYALGFYNYPGGQFNFSVHDNYYSDNVGNMDVDIYNGYADVTEENGCYTFENVPFGTYRIDEIMKDGWRNVSGLTEVTIDEGVEEFEIINELDVYDMHGFKWDDTNGDGIKGPEESKLSGWKIFIDEDGDDEWDETEPYDLTDDGDHFGWYLFEGLVPGEYKVCEELLDGWLQTYPIDPICHTVTLPDEPDSCRMTENAVTACEYNFGNFQKGSVRGCKYNDINGSGVRSGKVTDEGIEEPQMSGWTIRLYDFLWNKVEEDVTDPYFSFDYLMTKGTYYLCEVMQPGWSQTEPGLVSNYGYTLVDNLSRDITEGVYCKQIDVDTSGFDGSHYYGFGNIEDSELYVSETNNSWPNTLGIGDTFTYTITVRVNKGPVTDVTLINLPPEGFTPQLGTFSAISTNSSHIIDTSTVSYTSPGQWNLGTLEEDEIVTITYTVKVASDVDPGIYPDLSFAQGKGAGGSDLIALSEDSSFVIKGGIINENFVGTQVKVEEERELDEGEVLGAATELPRTGASNYLTLGAILSMIIGTLLLLFNPKKKLGNLVIGGILLIGVFTIFNPKPIYAIDPKVNIQIEQPQTPTDKTSFEIGYVVLDIEGRDLTIHCYEETYGIFDTHTTNSGNCAVEETIITGSGTYKFYVQVTPKEGTPLNSDVVEVVVDLDTPDPVTDYDKDEGTCTYTLTFKTANDGRTSKVQIFRSDKQPFTANNETLIKEMSVDPNKEYTYTDNGLPSCDKEYYYAVRTVDNLNNTSPFVTDDIVTVVEGETTTTEGTIATSTTVLEEEGEVAGETTDEDENGDVAGEETTTNEEGDETENGEEKTFWQKYLYVVLAAGVILAITVGYTYAQRRRY